MRPRCMIASILALVLLIPALSAADMSSADGMTDEEAPFQDEITDQ